MKRDRTEYNKKYREENKEKIKQREKKYREENKEKIKRKTEENKENRKEYYKINKEKHKILTSEYYLLHKEDIKDRVKKYNIENKEKIKLKHKEYYNSNKEKLNKYRRDYNKHKIDSDPLFKLRMCIRSLISVSFKNKFTKKSKKTIEILGCSFFEFKKYIENLFDENMNWENYGKYWQLDHIIPISWAIDKEELYKLNHYTNFQPLYWVDNVNKGNKFKG